MSPEKKRSSRHSFSRRARHRVVYWGARAALGAFGALPLGIARPLGRGLGRLAGALDLRNRRIALEHLRLAFGETMPEAERRRILRAMYANLGSLGAEVAHLPRLTPEILRRRVRIDGEAALARALEEGRQRGLMAITGHIGCWEWIPPIGRLLFDFELLSIARELANPLIHDLTERLRRSHGAQVAYRKRAGVRAIRTLKKGGGVGILLDQCTKGEGVFTPFFGRPAHTLLGPAQLALATNCVVVPVFLLRPPDPAEPLIFQVHDPVALPPEGEDAFLRACRLTAQLTSILESVIRLRPEQWVWFHRRWKRQPGDDPDPVFDPATGRLSGGRDKSEK